jgi:hypothetical protein
MTCGGKGKEIGAIDSIDSIDSIGSIDSIDSKQIHSVKFPGLSYNPHSAPLPLNFE